PDTLTGPIRASFLTWLAREEAWCTSAAQTRRDAIETEDYLAATAAAEREDEDATSEYHQGTLDPPPESGAEAVGHVPSADRPSAVAPVDPAVWMTAMPGAVKAVKTIMLGMRQLGAAIAASAAPAPSAPAVTAVTETPVSVDDQKASATDRPDGPAVHGPGCSTDDPVEDPDDAQLVALILKVVQTVDVNRPGAPLTIWSAGL